MSTTEVVHGGSGSSEHIELVVVEGRRPKSPVQVARVAPADPRRKAGDIAKHANTESAARNASEPVKTTTPQKLYRETVVGSVATDHEGSTNRDRSDGRTETPLEEQDIADALTPETYPLTGPSLSVVVDDGSVTRTAAEAAHEDPFESIVAAMVMVTFMGGIMATGPRTVARHGIWFPFLTLGFFWSKPRQDLVAEFLWDVIFVLLASRFGFLIVVPVIMSVIWQHIRHGGLRRIGEHSLSRFSRESTDEVNACVSKVHARRALGAGGKGTKGGRERGRHEEAPLNTRRRCSPQLLLPRSCRVARYLRSPGTRADLHWRTLSLGGIIAQRLRY
ncbi:hypothetical protein IEO21_07508 [Rhodonia placenta]|uniref:Uncharacterized protein n=1 Tax=Rhodonia placenta TaxID=104341 RepID=A0A8H7U097_9APHY|nr:hypothetical protein IEO21_07508 [Postia placenta]